MSKKSTPQEIAERIVRNMPIREVEYRHVETPYGTLYFALGKDATDRYHGLWAFQEGPGMARTIEFAPNQLRSLVIRELIEDGSAMLADLHVRGLLEPGRWAHGGR